MPNIEFAGASSRDPDSQGANTERLINFYPEPAGGRTQQTFKGVLGLSDGVASGQLFTRAMREVGGTLYVATGSKLQTFDGASFTELGDIVSNDRTSMAGLNDALILQAGTTYYVAEAGSGPEAITGARFTQIGSVTSLGQYAILTQSNGREFAWSDLADPKSLPELNFSTADGREDNILRAEAINGNLWLFKEKTTEIWRLTGAGGADAFARLSGGVVDRGLLAFNLLTIYDGGAFFVGDDGIAYLTSGAGLQPVSIRAVETAISTGEVSRCFYYEDEGHKFCVIRFDDRPAWVYDIATQLWHERGSGVDHERWEVMATEKAFGRWYAGDFFGKVHRLARVSEDDGGVLRRTMVSGTLVQDGQRFRVPKLELYGNYGLQGEGPDLFSPNAPTGTDTFDQSQNVSFSRGDTALGGTATLFDASTWEEPVIRGNNVVSFQAASTFGTDFPYLTDGGFDDDFYVRINGGASTTTFAFYSDIDDFVTLDYTSLTVQVTGEIARADGFGVFGGSGNFRIQSAATLADWIAGLNVTTHYTSAGVAADTRTDWVSVDSGAISIPEGEGFVIVLLAGEREHLFRNFDMAMTGTAPSFALDQEDFDAVGAGPSGFRPARVMLRVSRDYGHTFGSEMRRSLGDVGEYGRRAIWRNLGQAWQMTFEANVTDPVDVILYSTGSVFVT